MITLFSTIGCHLCEMAYQQLQQAGVSHLVKIVDIADDEYLSARYGVTIPVLQYAENELNWPFNFNELIQWLDRNGIDYHQ
ncbi:glutaredoxin family protein [Vibrio sp. CAIM 722]|uniref:Glutaredoxin family protein n=1 Tax=Vibrio eleionomae TaxID=2653505 RepID=A0A7X4RU89_9VIBR|nr:glutaredoxin family protein [Vibrio eleionomae]